MRIRAAFFLATLVAVSAASVRAEPLDAKRYMPVSEVHPGLVGVGKTTLEGTTILEFEVTVRAVLKNVVGPKQDLIIIECRGAGLGETGVIAGMSGSPIYVDGRLIGAMAYSFPWGKLPIAGVQPIEQMLAVTDDHPWAATGSQVAAAGLSESEGAPPMRFGPRAAASGRQSVSVPLGSLGLASLPEALAGRATCDLHPIQTPVMVSGASMAVLERLREDLAPFGMVPMQSGGAAVGPGAAGALLAPGAPLAIVLMRGDMEISAMGTITEIAGDRLYGLGHRMFAFGKADYPLATGIAHLVIPSLNNSFRLGAPAAEVGRITWDENTAVFGRISKDRAPMVPLAVTIRGPAKADDCTYRYEMVRHRMLSPLLASAAALESFQVHRALPEDHTVAYRVTVKPKDLDPIVRDNLAVSPDGASYVAMVTRSITGLLMNNPFRNVDLESVEIEAQVQAVSRLAEILDGQILSNAVRPGSPFLASIKVKPWRKDPEWITVPIDVPQDYPDGTYRIMLCGADEALREEASENPARFKIRDLESLVRTLRYDLKRDRLYIRLEAPGAGIAIGEDELPNLPPSMQAILSGAARVQVSPIRQVRVTTRPSPYVLAGSVGLEVTVDRHAPEK